MKNKELLFKDYLTKEHAKSLENTSSANSYEEAKVHIVVSNKIAEILAEFNDKFDDKI